MLVKCLGPGDAESYHALRLSGLLESPEAFGSTYEEEVGFTLEKIQSRIPVPGDDFVLGAYDEHNQLVGIATFRRHGHVKANHKGNVYGMYVAPESRGRGVGKALLQVLIERARALPGLEQIQLDVIESQQAARNLYLSHGFIVYGLEKNASKQDGRYYDHEYLVLHLI